MLLFQGCSWTGSLLVSKAYALLIRASEILKPLCHQYSCKQITGVLPVAETKKFCHYFSSPCQEEHGCIARQTSGCLLMKSGEVCWNRLRLKAPKTLLCFPGAQASISVQLLQTPFSHLYFIHCMHPPSFRYSPKATWKEIAHMRALKVPTLDVTNSLKSIILASGTISSMCTQSRARKEAPSTCSLNMWVSEYHCY